jgi:hypothetical protein
VLQRGERALTREPVKGPKHYNIEIPPRGSFKESLELGTVRRLPAHVINEIMPLPLLCFDKVLHLKKWLSVSWPLAETRRYMPARRIGLSWLFTAKLRLRRKGVDRKRKPARTPPAFLGRC